ncbi:MAG: Uma2 family endonuclease [Rhodocyclales bacterium]|nr:Uma2 family endonuclease [Rhodocyclales bacterium]
MRALPKTRCRADEYLAFENASSEKHEYVAGEIFAMVGATRRHNAIAGNLYSAPESLQVGRLVAKLGR